MPPGARGSPAERDEVAQRVRRDRERQGLVGCAGKPPGRATETCVRSVDVCPETGRWDGRTATDFELARGELVCAAASAQENGNTGETARSTLTRAPAIAKVLPRRGPSQARTLRPQFKPSAASLPRIALLPSTAFALSKALTP